MMGKPSRPDLPLFMPLDFDRVIPPDHPLRRLDALLDLSFVREAVAHLYGTEGNPSIDPEVVMRLMLLLHFENIDSERKLMLLMPARLDWQWFCRLDLLGEVPHHSVLSKARRRWGVELFQRLFDRVVEQCKGAGLVSGEVLHVDSTLVRANASLDRRVSRTLYERLERAAGGDEGDDEDGGQPCASQDASQDIHVTQMPRPPAGKVNRTLVSTTDPDSATVMRPKCPRGQYYRDHRLVDDHRGVIVATLVTRGDMDDARMLKPLLDQSEFRHRVKPRSVVGDAMYGTHENVERLQARGVEPILKKRRGKDSPTHVPWTEYLPPGVSTARARRLMHRRKIVHEGVFADAKNNHGYRRMRWRRRWRCQIQATLVSTVQNLKKLMKAAGRPPKSIARAAELLIPGYVVEATLGQLATPINRSELDAVYSGS